MDHFYIVSGNGRSGSNRLLDILDQSPLTVCRNEINEVPSGDFSGIGGRLFAEDFTIAQRQKLALATDRARYRRSYKDRPTPVSKVYNDPDWLSDSLQWALSKNMLRQAMASTGLLRNKHEWDVPPFCTNKNVLANSPLVLKLLASPAWTIHWHNSCPRTRILHNIRNPWDYLNSWFNRFVQSVNTDHFEQKFPDVPRILTHFGHDNAERLKDFSTESLVEIETWRWRYINEALHIGLAGSDRTMTVTYNSVNTDPVAAAERIFTFVGLPLDDQIAEKVSGMPNTLFRKKHSSKLDPAMVDPIIEKVLGDSPLRDIPGLFSR